MVTGEPAIVLFVPLISGGKRGRDLAAEPRPENAFTETDVRLLTTLAGSLSVALENARLVHETRQRNAELALINSVQDALAGELELQAIYDVVGDKLQEIFDAQVVDIAIYDEPSGLLHFPYMIERGERLHRRPMPVIGFRKHVMETREPLDDQRGPGRRAEQYGNPQVLSGRAGEVVRSSCRWSSGGKATGVVSLQNVDREHAFTESDPALLRRSPAA